MSDNPTRQLRTLPLKEELDFTIHESDHGQPCYQGIKLIQDEKEKAEYREPATIAHLLDTATSRLYMEGMAAAKSLKPIRSDRAMYERTVSLDLTAVPDGEYVIVFSWSGSEWDSPCKVIIKTN